MDIMFILIGNKADMDERVVSKEEGKQKAKALSMMWMETSSKTGMNI